MVQIGKFESTLIGGVNDLLQLEYSLLDGKVLLHLGIREQKLLDYDLLILIEVEYHAVDKDFNFIADVELIGPTFLGGSLLLHDKGTRQSLWQLEEKWNPILTLFNTCLLLELVSLTHVFHEYECVLISSQELVPHLLLRVIKVRFHSAESLAITL